MRANTFATLAKIGTVLVDRRFWVFVISIILTFTALPQLAENQDKVATDLAGGMTLLFQGLTILFGLVKLIDSWEKRPPSGVAYQKPDVSKTLTDVLKALEDAGIKL